MIHYFNDIISDEEHKCDTAQAEAAERDIKAAAADSKAALQVAEPPPPVPLTAHEEWERKMAEPMYFQVSLLSSSNFTCLCRENRRARLTLVVLQHS